MRHNATLDQVFDVFTEYRDRVVVFHYGGHASEDRLFLESTGTEGAVAHAEGLASVPRASGETCNWSSSTAARRGRRSPACSRPASPRSSPRRGPSRTRSRWSSPPRFYPSSPRARRSRAAYEAARGRVLTRGARRSECLLPAPATSSRRPRHPSRAGPTPPTTRVPLGATAGHRGPSWTGAGALPEAVGNPLFGLPTPLVDSWPDSLPGAPGVHPRRGFGLLRPGQGHPGALQPPHGPRHPAPYPLYSPTGVGKSSVLDAGLLPRLETDHEVRYLRRNPDLGLLGTLRQGLGVGGASNGQCAAWPSLARVRTARSAADRGPRSGRGGVHRSSSRFLFLGGGTAPDPEEPVRGGEAEVGDLLQALREAFHGPDAALRPRGKLILGFRNEWLDRVQQTFTAAKLGWEPMPLKPLDEAGIVEAIEGPAPTPPSLAGISS